jgi:hypothetical protein
MSTLTFRESRTGAFEEAEDGSYPVVLLTPGQGATAYYSEEVVARDAPTAFPKGTHVYLNHLQKGETRSPEKILGTLVADTTIRDSDGAAVNRFQPVKRWAPLVDDVHKIAGLSINAAGSAKLGIVAGKTTRIAESIDYHLTNSVDLVSYPGRAGSGFTESYDSLYQEAMSAYLAEATDVQPEPSASGNLEEGLKMETEVEAKFTELAASVATLTTLVESLVPKAPAKDEQAEAAAADRVAAIEATRIVESAEVPASVKSRLTESIKNGDYDVQPAIDEAIALREEIKTSFTESGFVVGANGASGSEPVVVNGWKR